MTSKILFPEAAVARMDLDTTRTRSAYEKIIADFEQGKDGHIDWYANGIKKGWISIMSV